MKNLEELNALLPGTLMENLGIHFLEVVNGHLKASMPVDERTVQPFGRLHGGASIALAETMASAGSWLLIEQNSQQVYTSEVSASHVGTTLAGSTVFAKAAMVHKGNFHHVWEVIIENNAGKLISVCRITNTVIPKR